MTNKVIPYIEDPKQCFIRIDGKILYVESSHEEFAKYYCNNKLTDREKRIYELWKEKYNTNDRDIYSDFLIKSLFYDKINTKLKRLIITSSYIPHVRFYNYYLMDWNINIIDKLVYDEQRGMFIEKENRINYYSLIDEENKEEIESIKEKTLVKDRYFYMK